MLGVLLSILAVAGIGFMIPLFVNSINKSDLENYITRNNPKNTYDVEKLIKEYYKQR